MKLPKRKPPQRSWATISQKVCRCARKNPLTERSSMCSYDRRRRASHSRTALFRRSKQYLADPAPASGLPDHDDSRTFSSKRVCAKPISNPAQPGNTVNVPVGTPAPRSGMVSGLFYVRRHQSPASAGPFFEGHALSPRSPFAHRDGFVAALAHFPQDGQPSKASSCKK